jgi:hypothetical protein
MKRFFRTPLLSLIVLLLTLGTMIGVDWRSTRSFLLIPAFLISLLFFVVLLRSRLHERKRDEEGVNQTKAENVS